MLNHLENYLYLYIEIERQIYLQGVLITGLFMKLPFEL